MRAGCVRCLSLHSGERARARSARPARGGIDASRRVCAVYSSRIRALHTRAQYGRAVSNREVPALLTYLLTYQASTTLYIYKRKKYAHNKCGNTTISTMYKCTCNAIRHKACVCGRVCGGSKDEAPALSHGYSSHSVSALCMDAHAGPARGCTVRMGSSTWSATPSSAWLANVLAGGGREWSARPWAGSGCPRRANGPTLQSTGPGASDMHAFERISLCFPPRLPARSKPPPTRVPVAACICPSSDAASSSAAASLAGSGGSAVGRLDL